MNFRAFSCVALAACVLLLTISCGGGGGAGAPADVAPSAPPAEDAIDALLPVRIVALGDLDAMRERRSLRILVPYNRTFYYIDRGKEMGTAAELGRALEAWLNKGASARDPLARTKVVFVPTPRGRLLKDLEDGYGDIAGGGLTVTLGRSDRVDFTTPFFDDVKEVLVTGPEAPEVKSLDDLGGKEILVRRSSSYWEHLEAINAARRAEGRAEVELLPADEYLEDDDLLELVGAGVVPWTVVDEYVARLWAPLLSGVVVRDDIAVNEGGRIAWAIRKGSPLLLAELNAFAEKHRDGTTFGNVVEKRYLADSARLLNPIAPEEKKKLDELIALFQKHATTYELDKMLLAAQGYQESRLDQTVKSRAGAVGVMQVLPSTAAAAPIEVKGVDVDPDRNIEAGAKYLRYLLDTSVNEPGISPEDRMYLAFAGYNAGPGNLRKFRALAAKSGLDPNVWFGNVEVAAARVVGRETVQYVSNIHAYYVSYMLSQHVTDARKSSLERAHESR